MCEGMTRAGCAPERLCCCHRQASVAGRGERALRPCPADSLVQRDRPAEPQRVLSRAASRTPVNPHHPPSKDRHDAACSPPAILRAFVASHHAACSDTSGMGTNPAEKSFFEKQRDALVGEIAQNLEQVLQNINKLNRSLEGVIAVSICTKGRCAAHILGRQRVWLGRGAVEPVRGRHGERPHGRGRRGRRTGRGE